MEELPQGWRRCSACKKQIGFGDTYWTCSVSTCNRKRTGLFFCSVSCWEVHLPGARHREAWAIERTAPRRAEVAPASSAPADSSRRRRRLAGEAASHSTAANAGGEGAPKEVLIVASRLKEYIRAKSGFSTSDRALDPLSEMVRKACDRAIRSARQDGRRTVLERDIPRSSPRDPPAGT